MPNDPKNPHTYSVYPPHDPPRLVLDASGHDADGVWHAPPPPRNRPRSRASLAAEQKLYDERLSRQMAERAKQRDEQERKAA